MKIKACRYVIALTFFLGLLISVNANAAPKKLLWPLWQAHQNSSTAVIDHQSWQTFLNQYVVTGTDGINRVRYDKVSPDDKAKLQAYLDQLSNVPIANYNRNEQLAYWINLYNALTVMTVLNHYPVDSIRDINLNGFWHDGPWDAKLISIDHVPLSLNDIEHRIIRPIWADPRTHYALNCASLGCPNLQKTVYTGTTVDNMLTTDAQQFINSPRGVNIIENKLIVSSIYDWYRSDFGTSNTEIIKHVTLYANPSLKEKLNAFQTIDGYQYDWELNAEK